MSIIQPHPEPLAGQHLFHNQVRRAVLVHVQCRNREAGLVRLEDQVLIPGSTEVKPDAEQLTSGKEFTRVQQNRPVRQLIVVEVCCSQLFSQRDMQ